ncbi:Uncharacterized protein Fot_10779 [Forsythia ovata]|uniref:Uncharacterized protein n=1 Tax=Forsythia ovata TaxID=205694 RepID=A0ABD1WHT8_9LAMI
MASLELKTRKTRREDSQIENALFLPPIVKSSPPISPSPAKEIHSIFHTHGEQSKTFVNETLKRSKICLQIFDICSENMGGRRGKTKEPMSWSDENEHASIGILYDNINKTEYRTFRKEGCKYYELLGEIFGGTTATGGLSNASTQLPPTSEEERQLEDDFLSRGVHVHEENDDDEEVTNTRRRDNGTSNERRRKEPKISKSGKLEACMAQWSSTISMRNDETELRTLYLKEKLARIQGKSSNQSGDSEATSLDSYMVCMNILNNMEGVSNEVYMKAIKAFKDPDFKMSFVMMPEIRRGPILELL